MPFTSRTLCSSLSYQVRLCACVCVFQSHEGASDRNGGLPRHLPYCSSSGFQAAKSSEASPRVTSLHSNLSTRPPVSQCFLFQLMPRGRNSKLLVCCKSDASILCILILENRQSKSARLAHLTESSTKPSGASEISTEHIASVCRWLYVSLQLDMWHRYDQTTANKPFRSRQNIWFIGKIGNNSKWI